MTLLTRREHEFLLMVCEHGRSRKEIAFDCHVTDKTVHSHMTSILSKCGFDSAIELVVAYWRAKLEGKAIAQVKERR